MQWLPRAAGDGDWTLHFLNGLGEIRRLRTKRIAAKLLKALLYCVALVKLETHLSYLLRFW